MISSIRRSHRAVSESDTESIASSSGNGSEDSTYAIASPGMGLVKARVEEINRKAKSSVSSRQEGAKNAHLSDKNKPIPEIHYVPSVKLEKHMVSIIRLK